jgi:hypothetical protein
MPIRSIATDKEYLLPRDFSVFCSELRCSVPKSDETLHGEPSDEDFTVPPTQIFKV